MEGDDGSRIRAFAHDLDRTQGLAFGIFLQMDLAFPVDLGDKAVREGVHAGHTDSVETTGDLVAVLVELTSGMKDGHDHLKGGAVLLWMHARRDASTVIRDPDRIVGEYGDVYLVAIACHRLVDTIIDDLIYQMVKPPLTDIADVHGGSFPHSLKAFQNLDTTGGILFLRLLHLVVLNHFQNKKIARFRGSPIKRTNIRKFLQI